MSGTEQVFKKGFTRDNDTTKNRGGLLRLRVKPVLGQVVHPPRQVCYLPAGVAVFLTH